MFIQAGNYRRFNDRKGISPSIRLVQSWKKSGSVRIVDFDGIQNVVCLENKKRKARISIKPEVLINQEYTFSVKIWSAIENKEWGAGTVITHEKGWHPSNGMWKRVSCSIRPGDRITINGEGKEGWSPGDKVYIDLKSILIS